MTAQLQQQITSILESLQVGYNFGALFDRTILIIISADIIMFVSIFYLLLTLSSNYKNSVITLLDTQARFFKNILYITLVSLILSIILLSDSNIDLIFMSSHYHINLFTQIIKFILILISLVIIHFTTFIPSREIYQGAMVELPLLFQILLSLSFIAISSSNFALLLLTLEAFSLTLYILTTIERTHGGITAAVKYFAFGTLGSVLLFWGVVHLYTIIPSLSYKAIFFLIENLTLSLFPIVQFASNLIVIGFLIKLGAAPLHQWVADVYTGSHTIITTIFATLVKLILFIIFVQLAYFLISDTIIDLFAISSLIVGCFATLKQSEIKRFIAYSSIVHVGFLLMGDISASLTYIITYVLSNLVFFSVILSIRLMGNELLYLNNLKHIRQSGHWNTALVVISLASSAGLPPFAGFYGKFLTWVSLFEDIYMFNDTTSYLILIISIILSLLTIFYYARAIAYLYISNDDLITVSVSENVDTVDSNNLFIIQLVSLSLLVFWTILQSQLLTFISLLATLIIKT